MFHEADRVRWHVDRARGSAFVAVLQPEHVVEALRTPWSSRDEFEAWAARNGLGGPVRLLPPSASVPNWVLQFETGPGLRYRQHLGGPPARRQHDGERLRSRVNLTFDVSLARRARRRMDATAAGKDNAFPRPLGVVAPAIARAGMLDELCRVAAEARQRHWRLLQCRVVLGREGGLDPSRAGLDAVLTSITTIEITFDRWVADAATAVQWLGPAVREAVQRRRTRGRREQAQPIEDVATGITTRLSAGATAKVYAGRDPRGRLKLVRAELRLRGQALRPESLRRLTGDRSAERLDPADPARLERQVGRIASAFFDVLVDAQARIPPETYASRGALRPVAVDLSHPVFDLVLSAVSEEGVKAALWQLAESGWCPSSALPPSVRRRGLARGVLQEHGRNVELVAEGQLKRIATRAVLCNARVVRNKLPVGQGPHWVDRMRAVVEYLASVAALGSKRASHGLTAGITRVMEKGFTQESRARREMPGLLRDSDGGVRANLTKAELRTVGGMMGPVLVPVRGLCTDGKQRRVQLRADIERAISFIRETLPNLDLVAVAAGLRPFLIGSLELRSAERPQDQPSLRAIRALDLLPPLSETLSPGAFARRVDLDLRVAPKYLALALLANSLPGARKQSPAIRLQQLRDEVLGGSAGNPDPRTAPGAKRRKRRGAGRAGGGRKGTEHKPSAMHARPRRST